MGYGMGVRSAVCACIILFTLNSPGYSNVDNSIGIDRNIKCSSADEEQAQYLPAYGLANIPQVAETVSFGKTSASNEAWITDLSVLSEPLLDPNTLTSYRLLLPHRRLEIRLPAFNVPAGDANGLCLSDMLLEAGFKDTVRYTIDAESQAYCDPVTVSAEIDYLRFDPEYLLSNQRWVTLIHLGGYNDNQWHYAQYGFQKSKFQLIRAIDGSFIISITNDNDNAIALSYLCLRSISPADYSALSQRQRSARGFYEIEPPRDSPSPPAVYPDGDMVVFIRDPMRPVYPHTRPALTEPAIITGSAAWGQTQPLTLALYSQNGITGISAAVSDLRHRSDPACIIERNAISIERVVCDYARLEYVRIQSYAFVPERLEPLATFNIKPDTSERLWLKIHVPAKTASLKPGPYTAAVSIFKDGALYKTVPVEFVVEDINLRGPDHPNVVWYDPYYQVYNEDITKVFSMYREIGCEPFVYNSSHRIISLMQNDNLVFDSNNFEHALDRMLTEEIIRGNTQILICTATWQELFRLVLNKDFDVSDPNLYFQLSDTRFVDGMNQLLARYAAVAQGTINNVPGGVKRDVTFIFNVVDEPGCYPWRRIVADRLYTIIKNFSGFAFRTGVTYNEFCDEPALPGTYKTPGLASIPPLTNLIDYKIWHISSQAIGYSRAADPNYYGNFGYYTSGYSHLSDPAYNRFLHGLFAFRTSASIVACYSLAQFSNDPYNGFDSVSNYPFPFSSPDFMLFYPDWNGGMFYKIGGLEALREGITDAKYLATLNNAILTAPNTPAAKSARLFVDKLNAQINPNYTAAYSDKADDNGYARWIRKAVSQSGDPCDYESFTRVRSQSRDLIQAIEGSNEHAAADFDRNGIVNFVDYASLCQRFSVAVTEPNYWNLQYDLNADGILGAADVGMLGAQWLALSGSPRPVVYFQFDESSGLTANDYYGPNNGTMVGFPDDNRQWVAGKKNWALLFKYGDTTYRGNYHIEVAENTSLDVNYVTMAAWVWVNSYRYNQRIIAKENGNNPTIYSLYLGGSGNRQLAMRIGVNNREYTLTGTAAIALQTWTHVAATFDGSRMRLFINGKPSAAGTSGIVHGRIMHSTTPVYIGASQFSSSRMFDGKIDELRIYDLPLSTSEIAVLGAL